MSKFRMGLALGVAFAALPSALASASADSSLGSRTPQGRFPNGGSFNPSFSQDRKAASLLAYDSVASDIVAGDGNGSSDVFVVHRAKPFNAASRKATVWRPGNTELVSSGMGGAPADGPSFLPDLDGDQMHGSHCVAFISSATNLVPGDTNGKPDAFVKDLSSGAIKRVSVNSRGEQADGASYDVQVDGACDRVVFTSDATNLAFTSDQVPKPTTVDSPLTGTQRRRCRARTPHKPCKTQKLKIANRRAPAVTTAPAAGTKQVYARILGGEGDDAGLIGLTFLASASNSGAAGNGDSFDASFGNLGAGCPKSCGTTSGDAVAFTSNASNLTGGDGNGVSDVYERTFRIATQHFTERRAKIPAYMDPKTRLVSATRSGKAGNGASDQPAVNGNGEFVAFRTAASDLVGGDSNGVTDVVQADMSGGAPVLAPVSRAPHNRQGDGASASPTLGRSAGPVLFQSEASNLTVVPAPDRNCVADVLWWLKPGKRLVVLSRDSAGFISGNPGNPKTDPCPTPVTSAALNPASSWFASYAAFEDGNPLLDQAVADQVFPGLRSNPSAAATMATSDATLHQVYVRYVSG